MTLLRYADTIVLGLCCASLVACSGAPPPPLSGEDSEVRVDRVKNELKISAKNRILWNGSEVSEDRLAALLRQTLKFAPEPELVFQPDAGSNYEISAKVLRIMKASGVSKFGFVGNEAYAAPSKSAD